MSHNNPKEIYTTADVMLEALAKAGVSYIFANMGSDHPSFIEGLAKAKNEGRKVPEVIICPHETVALTVAQGYSQVTGEAQAVFVHVDVGTQNLGGAVHNVCRSRTPVLIFAGDTPYTMDGEKFGSRNRTVNFIQDVYDQRGIVRPYIKWEYEIRTGKNVSQLVTRAIQMACSDPKGPVYLMGAREVLEEKIEASQVSFQKTRTIEPSVIPFDSIREIVTNLYQAENPLIITSYLGRNPESVGQLVEFCEKLAIPVIEYTPTYLNFPSDSPLHLGFDVENFVANADSIFVIDCDVPWLPSLVQHRKDCNIYYLDVDPLKEKIPLWDIPATKFFRGDSLSVIKQLNQYIVEKGNFENETINLRYERIKSIHLKMRSHWKEQEIQSEQDIINPQWLMRCLRELIDDETIIMDESVTNSTYVLKHLGRTKPKTYYGSGGTSLGWNGGAAIGAKMANPDKIIINLTGDGSYFFSIPSTVYWLAKRYKTPFMTIIFNNKGWNATKQNVLRMHPDGKANQNDEYWVNFSNPADLAGIAEAAGGAIGYRLNDPKNVNCVLKEALSHVKNGRCAVIDVNIGQISNQDYDLS